MLPELCLWLHVVLELRVSHCLLSVCLLNISTCEPTHCPVSQIESGCKAGHTLQRCLVRMSDYEAWIGLFDLMYGSFNVPYRHTRMKNPPPLNTAIVCKRGVETPLKSHGNWHQMMVLMYGQLQKDLEWWPIIRGLKHQIRADQPL